MQRLTLRVAVVVGLLIASLRVGGFRYVELLDARLGDYRLLQRGEQPGAPEVVIVAVDDQSVDRLGRWPWSRSVVARLVDRLTEAGAAVIGFDIVQSEPTAAPDLEALRGQVAGIDEKAWSTLEKALGTGSPEDRQLARAVGESDRTILGYFFDLDRPSDTSTAAIGKYNLVQGREEERREGARRLPPRQVELPQVTANLPELTTAARGLGYFNFIQEGDGYIRRAPLAIRYGEEIAVPLSLAMLRLYRKGEPLKIVIDRHGVMALRLGKTEIPTDERGQMLVNYRGRGRTFAHIPAADVLSGAVDAGRLRDKIVLVGVTATAVYDLRVTPFAPAFPGVEIHANVIDNVLRQQFLYRPWWALPFETVLVFLLPLVLSVVLHSLRGLRGAAATLAAMATYGFVTQQVFVRDGLVLTVLYPLAAILLTYSAITVLQYVFEERARRKTRRALELYLSPSLASIVSEHPEELRLGGEKRDYTVLFSDVRDFTSISEHLAPETLVELLNAYLGAMTDVIFAGRGMLDKYIGDGIMAVWGAPLPQEDQAALACEAAFGMQRRMRELEPEWKSRGWPEIVVRIGLNTGPMIFGNMGSADHMSLTVVGDNVNLGSRLEGLNKLYGTTILASESTIEKAGRIGVVRELDFVRVKGRVQPVRIFELMAPRTAVDSLADVVDRFAEGLAFYRSRDWDRAIQSFQAVLNLRPADGPARLFIRRCEALRINPPPPTWDAVTNMDEK